MIAKLLNSLEPFSTPINFELPLHKNCITKNLKKTNNSLFCLHESDHHAPRPLPDMKFVKIAKLYLWEEDYCLNTP